MEKLKRRLLNVLPAAVCALALSGCVSYGPGYGPAADPYQSGNYYDQYSPSYSYYPGQAVYPYPAGYYGYPYETGYYGPYYGPYYYGPRVMFGPSIYFGTSRGSSGVGVGTTFGF